MGWLKKVLKTVFWTVIAWDIKYYTLSPGQLYPLSEFFLASFECGNCLRVLGKPVKYVCFVSENKEWKQNWWQMGDSSTQDLWHLISLDMSRKTGRSRDIIHSNMLRELNLFLYFVTVTLDKFGLFWAGIFLNFFSLGTQRILFFAWFHNFPSHVYLLAMCALNGFFRLHICRCSRFFFSAHFKVMKWQRYQAFIFIQILWKKIWEKWLPNNLTKNHVPLSVRKTNKL